MGNSTKNKQLYLFADGACRGNPGPGSAGFVIYGDDRKLIFEGSEFIGPKITNNVAEYQALIFGIKKCAEFDCEVLNIFMDSQLAVKQVLGEYACKNAGLKPLLAEAQKILSKFPSYEISYIPRAQNSVADALANQALDRL